jgi:uncharacterized protein
MPGLSAIYRYPVKGLSPERLDAAPVTPGETLPYDRSFAIEQFAGSFDSAAPRYLPKAKFLMLMRDEKLAALTTTFDPETTTLTVTRGGKQVAKGNLDTPVGRGLIEQFFAAYLGGGIRPRVVSAPGHAFTDVGRNWISLINLASIRDLERVLGVAVDPLRFRANLYVEGLAPWVEKSWSEGTEIVIGAVRLAKRHDTVRCAATNVDPARGARDLSIPRTLEEAFGANACGIYLDVLNEGTLRQGDAVEVP